MDSAGVIAAAHSLGDASGTSGTPTPQATYLGRVVCIQASQVVAALSLSSDAARRELRKGALVKLQPFGATVLGIITGLTMPSPSASDQGEELYLAEIDLVGELTVTGTEFRRGVTIHPSLGEPIFAAGAEDLDKVYSAQAPGLVQIGRLHQVDRPAIVDIDRMLGKHFAVLGTTGAGKSCAVACLLHGILEHHPAAHILLLDPHGEYAPAFQGQAELINTHSLELPFWLLNVDELTDVLLGGDHSAIDTDALVLLRDFIQAARRAHFRSVNPNAPSDGHITVDTPFPYSMRELYRLIDEHLGRLDKTQPVGPLRWLRSRLEMLRADSRFGFMFGGIAVKDNMTAILGRLFRIPTDGKAITIVDLSGIPSEVLNAVVSVLCRMSFDFGLWSRGSSPLLLVCEEAHRYAPADGSEAFEPTKKALARIAKEGRKYGVSLAVVSQRPSDIDPTILSQCNSVFAFRLTNDRDQMIVASMIKDSSYGLLDFLPTLGNGEAIVAGEAVSVPQRMRFDLPPPARRPKSATAAFSSSWSAPSSDGSALAETVERWRRGGR